MTMMLRMKLAIVVMMLILKKQERETKLAMCAVASGRQWRCQYTQDHDDDDDVYDDDEYDDGDSDDGGVWKPN